VLRVDVAEQAPPDEPHSRSRGEEPAGWLYLGGRPDRLPDAVEAVLELARRLVAPASVPDRLAGNLKGEPDAGVRLRLLDVLTSAFPAERTTSEALRIALDDVDADVRARAALALGHSARPVLLAIAHGEGATDKTSATVVATLSASLTIAEASEVLRNALKLRKLATARACLRALGAMHAAEAAAMLGRVLAVERDEVAEWAAEALGSSGDASAEHLLLRALDSDEPRRRAAAARALGQCGTVAAVPALRAADADPDVRRAARQAIALIHSRASGAEPGQLSLAEDESGRLALASDDEGGRLSLADRGIKEGGGWAR